MATDIANLLNLSHDDLVGFMSWTPPVTDWEEPTGGLNSSGGSSSYGSAGSFSMMPGWPILALSGGFLIAWLIGGRLILRRRHRLLALPAA